MYTLTRMVVTVVFEGLRPGDIRVVADPLAELGTTLHAVMFGDHHGRARSLREELHKREHKNVFFTQAAHFQPLYGGTRARYLLPLGDIEEDADVHDRIESIASLEPEVFARQSIVSLIGLNTSLLSIDVLHSQEDREFVLEGASKISRSREDLANEIFAYPRETARRLCDFLHSSVDEWFADEWLKIGPKIRAERTERRQRIEKEGVAGILAAIPTSTEARDPHRLVFDKVNSTYVPARGEGILLVPSYHLSPHLFVKDYAGYPVILTYGVEPSTVDPTELTSRRLVVLSDPTRREICRAILRTPRTTSDLAERMRTSEPQMSRHLRALREVDLVSGERYGRFVMYTLNSRVIATLGTQLLAQLHR